MSKFILQCDIVHHVTKSQQVIFGRLEHELESGPGVKRQWLLVKGLEWLLVKGLEWQMHGR